MKTKIPRGNTAINLRNLDNTLHAAFKGECARRNRSMTGIVLALMRDVTQAPGTRTVIDLGRLSRTYPNPK
jgi:hypothetical protein